MNDHRFFIRRCRFWVGSISQRDNTTAASRQGKGAINRRNPHVDKALIRIRASQTHRMFENMLAATEKPLEVDRAVREPSVK